MSEWAIISSGVHNEYSVFDENHKLFWSRLPYDRAKIIVTAVNSHQSLVDALEKLVGSIDELIGSSEGVFGLHLNGDSSPWNELTEGGQFEDWLIDLETARAALSLANSVSPKTHGEEL